MACRGHRRVTDTFIDELSHFIAHVIRLLKPPTPEETDFHIDEASIRIFVQSTDHRVKDVLYTRMLDVVLCYRQRS